LAIPLRQQHPSIGYRGDFYGQTARGETFAEAISVDALTGVLKSIPIGITELACHPASEPDVASMYCIERLTELRTLCDPRIRAVLSAAEIQLVSFLVPGVGCWTI